MLNTKVETKVLSLNQIKKMTFELPKSWHKVQGILSNKRKDLEKHLQKISNEWSS